jgi:predicted unusual protein kinase regulating ubiquinone biosynthesis (AarF/ABC1/UbiB family)
MSAMKSFGLYRIIVIVSMATRFFLQIYVLQRKWRAGGLTDARTEWEQLLAKQASEYRRKALHLEGLMIKVGQFLSTRADVLPQVFTSQLKDLIDRVPPAPWKDIKTILITEWNVPLDQVFSEIEQVPVASASIADVYRAVLRNGSMVAVKVRRPNVVRLMEADFSALKIVLMLAKRFTNWGQWADLDALYRDFVDTTRRELDFRKERRNSDRFRAMIERHKLEVNAPACIEQWCTEKVLVMEWVDGSPISDKSWLEMNQIDRNLLIQRLIDVFFAQIFSEGFFHADPHPGNLLVSADGTLNVIDFGMSGTIRETVKQDMKQFLQGFIARDVNKMAKSFEGLGFLRTGSESLDLLPLIDTGLNFFLEKDFSRVDEQTMVEMLAFLREYVARNPLQLPSEFAFLGRTVSILSGVLAQIEPQLDYLQAVKPAVAKWLENDQTHSTENKQKNEGLFSFLGINEWGRRGLALLNEQALPRLIEVARLPTKVADYMDARKWNDFYSKRQQQTIMFIAISSTASTVLYIFEGAAIASLPACIVGALLFIYVRERRRWKLQIEGTTKTNTKERISDERTT